MEKEQEKKLQKYVVHSERRLSSNPNSQRDYYISILSKIIVVSF